MRSGGVTSKGISSAINAAMLAVMAVMPVLILLTGRTNDLTAGMALGAYTLYLMFYMLCMIVCRRRVFRITRIYCNNLFYINAKERSRIALMEMLLAGVFLAALLAWLSPRLAVKLVASEKARLSLYACAALVPVLAAEGALAGFAEGMGRRRTVRMLDRLRAVLLLLLMPVLGFLGHRYGSLRDQLLFTRDCAAAYAVLFSLGAVLVTELLVLIVLIVLRGRILLSLEPLEESGKPRYLGDKPPFLKAVWQFLFATASPFALYLLSAGIEAGRLRGTNTAQGVCLAAGVLGGHAMALFALLALLLFLPFTGTCYTLPAAGEEEDAASAAERFAALFHKQCVFYFPVGFLVAALARTLDGALFTVASERAVLHLRSGAALIPLLAFAMTGCMLLVLTRCLLSLFFAACLAFGAGLLAALLPFDMTASGMNRVIIACLAAALIFDLTVLWMLAAVFRAQHAGFVRAVALPLIASALTALLPYFLSDLLVHRLGEVTTVIVSAFCGMLLYFPLLSLMRGFLPDELKAVPGGKLLERISLRKRR